MTKTSKQDAVLQAIGIVHRSCDAAQIATPDIVIESMPGALNKIRTEVEVRWPLTAEYKERIVIGPIAAKNLSDWQPDLANMLMTLDYILRHDGEGVRAFLSAHAGSVIGARRVPPAAVPTSSS